MDLSAVETSQLRQLLDTLEPLLVNWQTPVTALNRIEIQAFEIAIRVADVLAYTESEAAAACVLASADPVSIQARYAMLWGSLEYTDELAQPQRSDWPDSFAAHYVGAAAHFFCQSGDDVLGFVANLAPAKAKRMVSMPINNAGRAPVIFGFDETCLRRVARSAAGTSSQLLKSINFLT